jgi:hypothetical protein
MSRPRSIGVLRFQRLLCGKVRALTPTTRARSLVLMLAHAEAGRYDRSRPNSLPTDLARFHRRITASEDARGRQPVVPAGARSYDFLIAVAASLKVNSADDLVPHLALCAKVRCSRFAILPTRTISPLLSRVEAHFHFGIHSRRVAALDRGLITELRPRHGLAQLRAAVELGNFAFLVDNHFAAGRSPRGFP